MVVVAKNVRFKVYKFDGMNISTEILRFAHSQMSSFTRKDVWAHLNSGTEKVSEGSFNVSLSRLVASGKLVKKGRGLYALCAGEKPAYHYTPSEEERILARRITEKFPFTKFCIWRPAALASFMQHIPVLEAIFVDVERVAMESMLSCLQQLNVGCQILLNPTEQECDRYLTNEKILIIRPLTGEAPVEVSEGMLVPTLEKILVDATKDKELVFAQGAEIFIVFANAIEKNDVNKCKLLRYASRRNRRQMVEDILAKI